MNVVETQNILLRRLVLKIEPEAAMNFDDIQYRNIPPTVEDLAIISPDFLDGKESKDRGTIPETTESWTIEKKKGRENGQEKSLNKGIKLVQTPANS